MGGREGLCGFSWSTIISVRVCCQGRRPRCSFRQILTPDEAEDHLVPDQWGDLTLKGSTAKFQKWHWCVQTLWLLSALRVVTRGQARRVCDLCIDPPHDQLITILHQERLRVHPCSQIKHDV
jgi:hypothetical protein